MTPVSLSTVAAITANNKTRGRRRKSNAVDDTKEDSREDEDEDEEEENEDDSDGGEFLPSEENLSLVEQGAKRPPKRKAAISAEEIRHWSRDASENENDEGAEEIDEEETSDSDYVPAREGSDPEDENEGKNSDDEAKERDEEDEVDERRSENDDPSQEIDTKNEEVREIMVKPKKGRPRKSDSLSNINATNRKIDSVDKDDTSAVKKRKVGRQPKLMAQHTDPNLIHQYSEQIPESELGKLKSYFNPQFLNSDAVASRSLQRLETTRQKQTKGLKKLTEATNASKAATADLKRRVGEAKAQLEQIKSEQQWYQSSLHNWLLRIELRLALIENREPMLITMDNIGEYLRNLIDNWDRLFDLVKHVPFQNS